MSHLQTALDELVAAVAEQQTIADTATCRIASLTTPLDALRALIDGADAKRSAVEQVTSMPIPAPKKLTAHQCPDCPKTFETSGKLGQHRGQAHRSTPKMQYKKRPKDPCPYGCGAEMGSNNMARHKAVCTKRTSLGSEAVAKLGASTTIIPLTDQLPTMDSISAAIDASSASIAAEEAGREQCLLCDEWVDDLPAHVDQEHTPAPVVVDERKSLDDADMAIIARPTIVDNPYVLMYVCSDCDDQVEEYSAIVRHVLSEHGRATRSSERQPEPFPATAA